MITRGHVKYVFFPVLMINQCTIKVLQEAEKLLNSSIFIRFTCTVRKKVCLKVNECFMIHGKSINFYTERRSKGITSR